MITNYNNYNKIRAQDYIKYVFYTQRGVWENSRIRGYLYCNCNYVISYVLQCRDYTLYKIKSFCDRGFHLWYFLGLYELIINKLHGVKPHQKGFSFDIAEFYPLIY